MDVIRVNERDNVAVALRELRAGEEIALPWGGRIQVGETIPPTHKVALEDLAPGKVVYRYGQPIGLAGRAIARGHWVHSHNLRAPEGVHGDLSCAKPVEPRTAWGQDSFLGFTRPRGPAGARNHLLILPTVSCANGVVRAIGRAVSQAVTLEHGCGCGRIGEDHLRTMRVLSGCGTHPNVGAVLLIGLGCEVLRGEGLAQEIASWGRPVEYLEIQKEGGSRKTAQKGIALARDLWNKLSTQSREAHPVSELILGLECGGSDALSGVTANPVVGVASDWAVAHGGTAILSETTEMIGTLQLLQARAAGPSVAEALRAMIGKSEELARKMLGDHAHLVVAPGNMDGGLSSIVEKSLGCIAKGGTASIQEVVPYGQKPSRNGLILMDTPGYDVESMGGLLGAGAQVILFTTGRGTPVGTPIAPVIKVASNSGLWHGMRDDLDLNAGEVADGVRTLEEVGKALIDLLVSVLNGQATRAEENQQAVIGFSMTMEAF
jgi:altronate dehydratase large subunit